MMSKSLDIESVKHDPQRKKFTLNILGSDPAFLEYDFLDRDQTQVDMFETFVPSSLRGQGLAKVLAEAAFTWAVKNNLKLKLSCWYLDGYLKRHPREDVKKLLISPFALCNNTLIFSR